MMHRKDTIHPHEEEAMLECIRSQPSLCEHIYQHRNDFMYDFVNLYTKNNIKKVYVSGQASGTYIGQMIRPFMEKLLRVEVEVTNPAYFNQYEQFNTNGVYEHNEMMMLCPAHSGTTTGPIEMARKCKELHIPVICTTYDITSPLARLSDLAIYKMSDEEDSYIETKGHVATLMIFYLCIIECAKKRQYINDDEYEAYHLYFQKLPDRLYAILNDCEHWYQLHKDMFDHKQVARYIASGPYYAAALEGSLKIAEGSRIAALVYDMEEFMHTCTTQIDENSLIFIVAPYTEEFKRIQDLYAWCKDYSENVIFMTSKDSFIQDEMALISDYSNSTWIGVIEYIVSFQVLAYRIAQDRGYSIIHAKNDGASKRLNTHIEG